MKSCTIPKRAVGISLAVAIMTANLPLTEPIAHAAETDKVIALTFDDGPNTTTTNQVLDVLEKYDALASFFLIGDNINEESAVSVKRAYDMGCEIDNHSKTHSHMGSMTEEEILTEINYVNDYVFEITGEYPKFFRPPFIATSQTMYDTIDMPFICGFDCKDFMADVTAQERADAIITAAKDGLIVLLHDAAGNDQTVEALETVIPTLQAEGYEFVTLTQLFERQKETPNENLLYSEVAKYPCTDYTFHRNIFTGEAAGDSSWTGWSDTAVLDGAELTELGGTFAVEVAYEGVSPPVITLQRWTGGSLWHSVQPFYYNGERACFLAEDLLAALEQNATAFTELDKITVHPYSGSITMTKVDLLVKNDSSTLSGDVDLDGTITITDVILLQKYLLNIESLTTKQFQQTDMDGSTHVDSFDLAILKRSLLS